MPGLFVRLKLPGSGTSRGLLIQDRAVGTDLDKRFVFVVTPDHTIEYRAVSLGPIVDGLRVVRAGAQRRRSRRRQRAAARPARREGRAGRCRHGGSGRRRGVRRRAGAPPAHARTALTPKRDTREVQACEDHEILPILHRPADLRGRPVTADSSRPAASRCSGCRSANTRASCRRRSWCAPPIQAPTRR